VTSTTPVSLAGLGAVATALAALKGASIVDTAAKIVVDFGLQ